MQHEDRNQVRWSPIRIAGGIAVLLAMLGSVGALAFAATRDSDGRAKASGVISYADPSGEYSVHPDGTAADAPLFAEPLVVQSVFPYRAPWVSPAGDASAYLQTGGDETWISLEDRSGSHRLAQLAGPGDPPLVDGGKGNAQTQGGVPLIAAWSPDGAYLAFGSVSELPYALNITSVGPVTTERYAVGSDYVGEAAWSHDGRYLAISSYSIDRSHHTVFIWDRESGELRRLIDGCHIVWSPDDSHLVIHRDPYAQPGVSVVSIDGAEVRSLSSDPNAFPSGWVAR